MEPRQLSEEARREELRIEMEKNWELEMIYRNRDDLRFGADGEMAR